MWCQLYVISIILVKKPCYEYLPGQVVVMNVMVLVVIDSEAGPEGATVVGATEVGPTLNALLSGTSSTDFLQTTLTGR